jgi:CO/xanthine dehydrogenase Mo-binding subunit
MTASVPATAPTVLAPTREELIRIMRRRHPRISDARLGKLLDHRLSRSVIDVIRSHTGEFDIRLTAEMLRN